MPSSSKSASAMLFLLAALASERDGFDVPAPTQPLQPHYANLVS